MLLQYMNSHLCSRILAYSESIYLYHAAAIFVMFLVLQVQL